MRVFFNENDTLARCIEQQLDARNAWASRYVRNFHLIDIPTLEQSVLLGMYCLTIIKTHTRFHPSSRTRIINAMLKTSSHAVITSGNNMSTVVQEHTTNLTPYTSRTFRCYHSEFHRPLVSSYPSHVILLLPTTEEGCPDWFHEVPSKSA